MFRLRASGRRSSQGDNYYLILELTRPTEPWGIQRSKVGRRPDRGTQVHRHNNMKSQRSSKQRKQISSTTWEHISSRHRANDQHSNSRHKKTPVKSFNLRYKHTLLQMCAASEACQRFRVKVKVGIMGRCRCSVVREQRTDHLCVNQGNRNLVLSGTGRKHNLKTIRLKQTNKEAQNFHVYLLIGAQKIKFGVFQDLATNKKKNTFKLYHKWWFWKHSLQKYGEFGL